MTPTLPSAIARILWSCAWIAATTATASVAGCGKAAPPVAPGPPIPAEAEITVGAMHDECAELLASLDAWKTCPNLEDRQLQEVVAWREAAETDFAASDKAAPDAPSQHAIAVSCHRGAGSVHAAIERCRAGKPPKRD